MGRGGTVGVGRGGSSLGGVNISNASSNYLQLKSDSCNSPAGYHPSDSTSGQSIVLGHSSQ